MFTIDDLKNRVSRQPFVPLRIVTSSGERVDIYHPDLIMVGKRDVTVGIASLDDPSVYDQVTRLAIMHITALEDLPVHAKPPADGNGQS